MPMKVSSLKSICSNPLSICQSLERKKLITLYRKENEISTEELSFDPIEKK